MKRALAVAVLISCSVLASVAQAPPNLENGFKAWGSYESSHVDTVNLLNGNQMLHAPLLPNYPQRGGSLTMQPFLYQTSKNWQFTCSGVDAGGNPLCYWGIGGRAGVDLRPSVGLALQRTLHEDGSGTGTVSFRAFGYSIQDASGTMHRMTPTGPSSGPVTEYDSIDTSGYHLHLSNPDTYGVMQTATVTDRHGNQYVSGGWGGGTVNGGDLVCPQLGGNRLPPVQLGGGLIEPNVDDAPFGQQDCPQVAGASQVTDSNGNRIDLAFAAIDTLGRTMPFLNPGVPTTDPTGCSTNRTFASALTYSYAAPDGSTQQLKLCYGIIPISATFGGPWAGTVTSAGGPELVTVILGDGTKWTFDYDNYGEVTSVGLPTGGSINYTWTEIAFPSCAYPDGGVSRAVATRILNDNSGHSFTWTYHWGTVVNGVISNFVTDPLGNDSVHVFTALDGTGIAQCSFFETQTQYFQGTGGSRQLLKQVDTAYSGTIFNIESSFGTGLGNVVPTSVQTKIYPSAKVSKIEKTYAPSPYTGGPISGAVATVKEYDWGPSAASAPLLRETDTVYQWQKNSAYLTAGLIDLPASVAVISPNAAENIKSACPINGSGGTANCAAETDYFYDETGYLTTPTPAITTQHNTSPPNGVRGNQTTVSKWLNTPSAGFISSHTNWFDTGEPFQTTDPLGHTTTHTYDPFYKGAYSTQTCSPQTGSITHCVSGTYDFNTGVLTSFTNENATQQASGNTPGDANHTTTFTYDKVFHLVQAQAPPDPANSNAQATTNFTYSSNTAPTTYPFTITRTRPVTNALTDSATNTFDGLGRLIKSQHTMPSGPSPSIVDTTYDELGRVATVSNPYFTTSDLTYGITQTIYDAFDRPVLVQKPDGSFSTVTYQDNCTMVEDEAGKGRRTCTDALGRLIEVEEPGDSSAPAPTDTSTVSTQATAIVSLSGSEQSFTVSGDQYCAMWDNQGNCVDWEMNPPVTTYDSGTVKVTVNGRETSVFYAVGDTASVLASRLASAINADGASVVTASASGTQITLTAKTAGQTGDYTASFTTTWDTSNFAGQSFSGLVSNLRLLGGADLNQFAHTYLTLYSYDVFGNLLCVEQHGNIAPGSPNATGCSAAPSNDATSPWRVRRFTYDSFSRLLTSSNPESNTVTPSQPTPPFRLNTTYSYDLDGNLLQKTSPAPNQAVNGTAIQTISYCYDELHRATGKAYGAQTCQGTQLPQGTSIVTYTYDSGPNAKGKLVSLTDQAGTANYSYDTLGRTTTEQRTTAGINKSIGYAYNLDGSLKSLTYPSNRVINYTPDSAGRLISAIDATGTNYVSSASYNAPGALIGFTNNGAVTSSFFYNPRLQLCRITAWTSGSVPNSCTDPVVHGNLMDRGYNFNLGAGDNGNVISITNYRDTSRSQSFTYDPLNRIASGSTTANTGTLSWGENYTIDAWGNLMIAPMSGKAHGGNFQCAGDYSNRATCLSYDPAGNVTVNGSTAYTYDQENRLSSTAGTSYAYDANGNRVKKSSGSTGTLYWYASPGIIAETDVTGTLKSEYVFFGGKRIARIDSPGGSVHYYLSDHLNSTTGVVSATGSPEEESDYSPFGTEYQVTGTGANHYKFAGKERDSESQLDYFGARFYANALGRFMSTDPVSPVTFQQRGGDKAKHQFELMLQNPQYWNQYPYALNSPLRMGDPTGQTAQEAIKTVNDQIKKQGLTEARKQLTAYGKQLAEKMQKGELKSKQALDLYQSKAQQLTGEAKAGAKTYLLAAGSALDLRHTDFGGKQLNVGSILTRDTLGVDTLHHLFTSAYLTSTGATGFAAVELGTMYDRDPEDRLANQVGVVMALSKQPTSPSQAFEKMEKFQFLNEDVPYSK